MGDTLTAKVTVREKRKEENLVVFDTRCVNQAGKELVAGTVTVQAPTSRLVYDNIKPPKFELRWGDAFAQLIKGCQGCEPVSRAPSCIPATRIPCGALLRQPARR